MDNIESKPPEYEPEPQPIKVYHYTNNRALHGMTEGYAGDFIKDPRSGKYVYSEVARGLYPIERAVPIDMSSGLDYQAIEPCVYALLEPKDKAWFEGEMGKRLMEHTKGGGVLIEIQLAPEQLEKNLCCRRCYICFREQR